MKKLIGLIVLAAAIFAWDPSDSKDTNKASYGYINLDTFGLLPTIGGGYRYESGYNGFDISASGGCFAHVRAMYLCYPAKKGPYIGAGMGAVYLPDYGLRNGKVTPSFEGTLGCQIKNHNFFQLNAIVEFYPSSSGFKTKFSPGLTFGYGF